MRLFFHINYTQDTMQKYILHHPIVFWWSIIVWFPCQVWWTGFHYHSTCFNSWWNARCSCAWDYIEFTTLFAKSWCVLLFLWICECVVWGKVVDLLNVFFTSWIHDMYVWLIISWKGKVTTFPCILCFVYWGVNHQKDTHTFSTDLRWICMDMFGYLIRLIHLMCKLSGGFRHIFVVVFGVDFVNLMNFQGGGWQLEACKSFGTCQDWGPLPAIIFDEFCEHLWPTCLPKRCFLMFFVGWKIWTRPCQELMMAKSFKNNARWKKKLVVLVADGTVKRFIWRVASNIWSWKLDISGSTGDAILNEDCVVCRE